MTITNTNTKTSHTGTGGVDVYALTFEVFAVTEAVGFKDVSGVITPLTVGVDYSIALVGPLPAAPTITALAAIPGTDIWHFIRVNDRTQDIPFSAQGKLSSARIEEALDIETMRSQEADFWRKRSIHLQGEDADELMELPLVASRLGKLLKFGDTLGEPTAVDISTITPAGTATTAFSRTLLDDVDAATARATLGVLNMTSGTLVAQPTAAAHGAGYYYATDTDQFYFSNATVWVEVGVQQFATTALSVSSNVGRLVLDVEAGQISRDNGATLDVIRPLPPLYLANCATAAFTTTDIVVRAGLLRDKADTRNITVTQFTKDLSAAWAAGDGLGGLPGGVVLANNTWYRVFILAKPDGTIDAGIDTTSNASNLLTAAAAGGYTLYRQVGWISTVLAGTNLLVTPAEAMGGTSEAGAMNKIYYSHSSPPIEPNLTLENQDLTRPSGTWTCLWAPPQCEVELQWQIEDAAAGATGYVQLPKQSTQGGSVDPAPKAAPGGFFPSTASQGYWSTWLSAGGAGSKPYYPAAGDASTDFHAFTIGWWDHRRY